MYICVKMALSGWKLCVSKTSGAGKVAKIPLRRPKFPFMDLDSFDMPPSSGTLEIAYSRDQNVSICDLVFVKRSQKPEKWIGRPYISNVPINSPVHIDSLFIEQQFYGCGVNDGAPLSASQRPSSGMNVLDSRLKAH